MGRPTIEATLDAIYEAAAAPHLWRNAMEKIGDRFDGAAMVLGLQPIAQPTPFAVCSRLDENLLKVFADRYTTPDNNPTIPYYFTRPVGEPFDLAQLYGPRKFVRLDYYKDLFESQKVCLRTTAILFKTSEIAAPIGLIGPSGCEALTSAEVDELKFLFRHIARALRITGRIVRDAAEQQAARLALDWLKTAAIIVSVEGKIMVLNVAAEEIIRAGDGISVVAGRLRAANSKDNAQLGRLIAVACSPMGQGGGSLGINRPSGALKYGVEVAPLSASPTSAAGAVIFINDPVRVAPTSINQLIAVFGLTSAEARAALKIAEGATIANASEQLGITVNTLKTLLKRTFAKTGARRQSELVTIIASTIPTIRWS